MVLVELSTKLRRDHMRELCDYRFFSPLLFEKLIVSSKGAIKILEKFYECLETWYSILKPRTSILDPRSSISSKIEFRVETVSWHLHGTVGAHEKSLVMKKLVDWQQMPEVFYFNSTRFIVARRFNSDFEKKKKCVKSGFNQPWYEIMLLIWKVNYHWQDFKI